MAVYFVESSALVKRYAKEIGTRWIQEVTDPANANSIYIAEITIVEVISALRKNVRIRSISDSEATSAISQFRFDVDTQYLVFRMTSKIILRAAKLTETYTLRAYDAVQLAAALEVFEQSQALGINLLGMPALTLISADNDLNNASIAEGLTVENPMNQS